MSVSIHCAARALCLALAACVLAGCAGQLSPGGFNPGPSESEAAQAAARGDYARAARSYRQAASAASSQARAARLRFEAGLAAAQAGNADSARQLLAAVDKASLDATQRARYELAQTEIRIAGVDPGQALTRIPKPRRATPPAVAERALQKRAQLYFADNDTIGGIEALVQRDRWLQDQDTRQHNDDTIYAKALKANGLGQGPDSRAARDAGNTTRGWLALAGIGQRQWPSRRRRDRALAAWEHRYPGHPATRNILRERFHYTAQTRPTAPGRPARGPRTAPRVQSNTVALALPTRGKFKRLAKAIRAGFMFAYRKDNTALDRPLVYDSSDLSAADIVARARRDNVGILDGPLKKAKVAALARAGSDIPTVALNTVDTAVDRAGFYQLGLAPAADARTVARHASEQGFSRAIALFPDGQRGQRVFDAFRAAFSQLGGQIVDRATYHASKRDYRDPIQQVLKSYHSGSGVDFIFVAARPVQARLIRSQLRFYHATKLPMLATSHVYTGVVDPGDDIDLNGVQFADLPWVIGKSDFIEQRRAAAKQRYGDIAKHYKRLFALGMDAWLLTDHIARGGLHAGDAFEGMTGVLSVGPDGRIKRYLAWGVFHDGKPKLRTMPNLKDADSAPSALPPWVQPAN